MFVRYAPGEMRKETAGRTMGVKNVFMINRMKNNKKNYETGLTAALGLDYKLQANEKKFDFSVAQVINNKENKNMDSETSMDEKLSDVIGEVSYNLNDNISLRYDFAIDQNYSELNYNDIGATMNFDNLKIKFNYLKEQKHFGENDYFNTNINYDLSSKTVLSFETKRDLITNSSQFYNLSYEYINDCLKAGLVYRREFYTDSELEAENSLMFKITLIPLGATELPELKR